MRVLLETPIGELKGILTVFCVNFNHSAGGENVYIQAS